MRFVGVTVFLLGLLGRSVVAQDLQCPQFFQQQTPPHVTSPQEAQATFPLCHDGYASLYSGRVQDPLWSADVLTQQSVMIGHGMGRHGVFHVERALPPAERVSPSDYRNPPGAFWDRGHMVPNGDMPSPPLQEETFSMANVVPQDADNNERLHEGIESVTRQLAQQYGKIYVVTGPVFSGQKLLRLNNKAFIPTMIFKAIYIPQKGGAAYIENNMPGMQYAVISLAQLNDIAHIDAFPSLSDEEKTSAIELPTPKPSFKGQSREAKAKEFYDGEPQSVTLAQLSQQHPNFVTREKAAALGLLPAVGAWAAPRLMNDYRKREFPQKSQWRKEEERRGYVHHRHRRERRVYREEERRHTY